MTAFDKREQPGACQACGHVDPIRALAALGAKWSAGAPVVEERKNLEVELVQQNRELKAELKAAWDMSNRWMKAAMDLAPMTTMAFDPGAPEAFAESRKRYREENP